MHKLRRPQGLEDVQNHSRHPGPRRKVISLADGIVLYARSPGLLSLLRCRHSNVETETWSHHHAHGVVFQLAVSATNAGDLCARDVTMPWVNASDAAVRT